jgi:hypothetical protein
MTAPEVMTVHPTDETLAAFIDDRLNSRQKSAVIEHLAQCDECRTFLNDVNDIKAMDEAEGNVVEMPKRGGWRVAVASLAVAAGLVVVFGDPIRTWLVGPRMESVAAVEQTMAHRPTKARLSVDQSYKPAKPIPRGTDNVPELFDNIPQEVLPIVIKFEEAKRPAPHPFGVTLVAAGKFDLAIPYLEKAAETDPEAMVDLAAALLARGKNGDNEKALALSKQSDTPQALWNRALALEYLGRYQEAIAAWNAYLRVDPESLWAEEARQNVHELENLRSITADTPPQPSASR